jgi:hypothetical protein
MAKFTTANVQHEIEHRLDGLKHGIMDKAGTVKDSAISGIDFMGAQIKKHPVAALAIAFGVGYVAMRLVRR